MPVAGVPLRTPVFVLKVTPLGNDPVMIKVGTGKPVAVTVNDPDAPTVKVVLATLVMLGVSLTVKAAVAVFPVPPLVDETAPDVLVKEPPAVVSVMFTTTVQELLTAMLPPVSEMLVPPGAAEAVPPQLFVSPFGVATSNPAGRESLNATPVWATVFPAGLVIVKVNALVAFKRIVVGLKAFAIERADTTVSVAVAVFPVPPWVDETAPDVLVKVPAAVPLMLTTTVQELLAATLPPVNEMLVPPAVAEALPLQLSTSPFGVATTKPAGSVSLNATPVWVTVFPAGLVIVKVSVLLPFKSIAVGLKALAIEGGVTTVNEAVAVFPVPPFVEETAPDVLL